MLHPCLASDCSASHRLSGLRDRIVPLTSGLVSVPRGKGVVFFQEFDSGSGCC